MCGRYQFTAEDNRELQQIVREVQEHCGHGQFTPGDVYPSAKAPVLLESHGTVAPDLLYWGFRTPQALVINARSETAEQRSLFRDSFEQRRCVIPSTGFYEWSKDKRKTSFTFRISQFSIWPESTRSGTEGTATAFSLRKQTLPCGMFTRVCPSF